MEEFHPIGGPKNRATVIFKGGRFEGPRMKGTILPGGGDWETINPDSTAHLDTRYNLQIEGDGNPVIYLQTTGIRTGPKDVLDSLGTDESIPASDYFMRLHLTFETGHEKYKWLNNTVAIASSGRTGNMVIYDAYAVL